MTVRQTETRTHTRTHAHTHHTSKMILKTSRLIYQLKAKFPELMKILGMPNFWYLLLGFKRYENLLTTGSALRKCKAGTSLFHGETQSTFFLFPLLSPGENCCLFMLLEYYTEFNIPIVFLLG